MPLTTCPDCGHQVSDRAPTCPNCGAPLRRSPRPDESKIHGKSEGCFLRTMNCGCIFGILFALAVLALIGTMTSSSDRTDEPPPTAAAAPQVLDVMEIAGHTPAEVARVLGEPTGSEDARAHGQTFPAKFYRGQKVRVVYVDNRADWIEVHDPEGVPFAPTAIASFGLDPAPEPSFANAHVIRWEDHAHPALRGIYVFPKAGGDAIDYVLFYHRTKP